MSLSWQLMAWLAERPRYIQRHTRTRTDVALGPARATFGELRTPPTESYRKSPDLSRLRELEPRPYRIKAGDHIVPVTFAFTLAKRPSVVFQADT